MRRLLLVCVALLPATSMAQSVTGRVVMTTDRSEVPVGQPFRLQIRADMTGADVDRFDVPDLTDFEVRSRQVSRPVQFRFGFGGQQQVVQSTTIHTYTLVARSAGRYDLTPATVTAGGQSFSSNPITVVVGGSAPLNPYAPGNPPQPNPQPNPQPQQNPFAPQPQQPSTDPITRVAVDGARVDPQAFLRTVADEATPFVGQQVTISVYLYIRSPIRSAPQVTREPTADGFWVHDLLPPQRTLDAQTQTIQGVYYRVYLIRRFAAFPLREGDLTVGAPEMVLQTGSLFDLFGGGGGQGELRRTGVPITITAQPLPNPPPNAVVGSYTIDATLDQTQARTGDAITLTAVVRGTGNVRDVSFPLPQIDGLEVLPPSSEDQIEQPSDRVGGSRRIQWLIIPQRPGTFTLPTLSLQTFDPQTETYSEVRGPTLTITAAGNALDPAPDPDPDPEPTVEDTVPDDAPPAPEFGPLRNRSELRRATPPVSSQWWYWVLLFGLPLLAVGAVVGRRIARKRATAPKPTSAKKRLADAASKAKAGETRAFYGTVATTLKQAVESKLGEAVGGLTHDALRRELRQRGMDPDIVRRLIDELESCDFARFSSAGGSQAEMTQTLDRARSLLADLDAFQPREAA